MTRSNIGLQLLYAYTSHSSADLLHYQQQVQVSKWVVTLILMPKTRHPYKNVFDAKQRLRRAFNVLGVGAFLIDLGNLGKVL